MFTAKSTFRLTLIACLALGCLWAQSSSIKFNGKVDALPQGTLVGNWTIGSRTVIVTAFTQIEQERGPVAVGSCVDVEGTQNANGTINATEIKVRSGQGGCPLGPEIERSDVEFRGVIQSISQSGFGSLWTVSGRKVQVNPSTNILPRGKQPKVGDCVEIKGIMQQGDIVLADRVQGQGDGACKTESSQQDEPKLIGKVEALPASGLIGDWRVSSQTVRVSSSTRIEMENGVIQVGSCVEVRGPIQNSIIMAVKIESLSASECQGAQPGRFQFMGVIETTPASGLIGNWKISGRDVTTNSSTVFDVSKGQPIVGACVEVEGTMPSAGGAMVASRFEVKSASGVCILRNGIVGGGSLTSISLSPGQIVSIFGLNIGPATQLPLVVGSDNRVTSSLGNTRVLFDGTAARLLFVSQNQINAVVPCALAGKTSTVVQIETNGAWSNPLTVPVIPTSPSIFTLSGTGTGQGAILNYDPTTGYSVNGAANPSARLAVAIAYATGFGVTNPACTDGAVVNPFQLPRPVAPVSMTVGGKAAAIQYAGGAPGFVTGVFQVNYMVPADVTPGAAVPVVIKVGDKSSQDGVTMAVK